MSHWHGRGTRNDAQRTGVHSKHSIFQLCTLLNEILEILCKVNLHLKDTSLIWHRVLKNGEKWLVNCAHPYNLSFCLGLIGFIWSDFPQCSVFVVPQWDCHSDNGYNYPHFEMHYKRSVHWCNWHTTWTDPAHRAECPPSLFTLQCFNWL